MLLAPSTALKLEAIKIAIVPGQQFNLRYHKLSSVFDSVLECHDSTEVLIYLPNQEKPISIPPGGDNIERCIRLQNKLQELTS